MTRPEAKICVSCGRRLEWRKKWERNWDEVKYCSKGCRSRGVTAVDLRLEESILRLLSQRAGGATICPSEAARLVGVTAQNSSPGNPDPDEAWRSLMEPARAAARRLVASGQVQITQKGRVVDPSTAKGPIRIRRRRS